MQDGDSPIDADIAEILDSCETLKAVSGLGLLIPALPWFRMVGEPLDPETAQVAESFLWALGAPDAAPALLGNWEDAAGAAETQDFNDPAWEAEEQLRAALTDTALAMMDETALEIALSHISTVTAEAAGAGALEAAEHLRIDDESFLNAAAGAAVAATHNAALVLAAGEESDHAFAAKFALFERGRWPVSIVGNSFNIF